MQPLMMIGLGVVAGLAASFSGLGGGFLIVPLLVMLGFTPPRAVGTSFLAILIISCSALFAHGRLEHVDYRTGLLLGLGGVLGGQVGARLVPLVSGQAFNKIFALLLLGLSIKMFLQK